MIDVIKESAWFKIVDCFFAVGSVKFFKLLFCDFCWGGIDNVKVSKAEYEKTENHCATPSTLIFVHEFIMSLSFFENVIATSLNFFLLAGSC